MGKISITIDGETRETEYTSKGVKLFKPVRLDENVYSNILYAFQYLWHYTKETLPQHEMERWNDNVLSMSDLFDFSTADNWNENGFMTNSKGVISGSFAGGVEVMLQNTTLKGQLQLDPTDDYIIKIYQKEMYVGLRRIAYLDFGKYNQSFCINARKYIYSPWKIKLQ